jgi:predicted NBD/HSP70 family sugar kinase
VYRGHHGVAGEIAHIVTAGLHGEAISLTEVFAQLGLRRRRSTAIDVDALLGSLTTQHPDGRTTVQVLAEALRGVVLAAIALADPDRVVLGGAWGRDARVIDALTAALDAAPRTVPVVPSRHDDFPERAGAAAEALEQLRVFITAARTEAVGQRRK